MNGPAAGPYGMKAHLQIMPPDSQLPCFGVRLRLIMPQDYHPVHRTEVEIREVTRPVRKGLIYQACIHRMLSSLRIQVPSVPSKVLSVV